MMIETETLLDDWPRCGGGPLPKPTALRREIRLKRPQWGYQGEGRPRGGETVRAVPEQPLVGRIS